MSVNSMKSVTAVLISLGCIIGIWALATLLGGLAQANWKITELFRQYLITSGMIKPIHTVVDFYTHIKGIEYIICVAFFVAFPLFFRYVDRRKNHLPTSSRSGV